MKVRFRYIAYIAVFVVIAGTVGAFAGVARDADVAPWVPIALMVLQFLVVVGGGLGINVLRRRTERRELTSAPDSFERQAATQAQAKAFLDLLILTLVAGGLFVVFPTQTNPAWVLIGLVVVLVGDFWVRYAVITTSAAKAAE
ncbi:hypothetical protein [Cryobacterium arcticum]|uniref:Uncharacterized protein n=1 Tax=Cryobacterium arcticum TaxID=670052 RepID=A0A317ZVA6_9MICO|nr:hypothetical protein [Cryobacterium arcticum]PXA69757.1 hypothetical protein CTB96_09215 [Cryobacterium arcticum]